MSEILYQTWNSQFIYPTIMGLILAIGGSFGMGFAFAALPAFVVGIRFLYRPTAEGEWPKLR